MSSPAAAAPVATPAKAPKRRVSFKKGSSGSSISSLILKAVAASSGGMSLPGLKKALKAGGYDVDKKNGRILMAIKRLVAKKALVRTKGSGASGSFRVNKKPPTPRKKKVVKKKTSVKRVKKTKKPAAGTSSTTPKKSPKKKKAKSPKKPKRPASAKRPAAAKKPKKAAAQTKVKRKATKTRRTRGATPRK